jgi:hypothetical protein
MSGLSRCFSPAIRFVPLPDVDCRGSHLQSWVRVVVVGVFRGNRADWPRSVFWFRGLGTLRSGQGGSHVAAGRSDARARIGILMPHFDIGLEVEFTAMGSGRGDHPWDCAGPRAGLRRTARNRRCCGPSKLRHPCIRLHMAFSAAAMCWASRAIGHCRRAWRSGRGVSPSSFPGWRLCWHYERSALGAWPSSLAGTCARTHS